MENKNEQDNQIQIELPEDVAQGTYSNLAIIAHSSSEFIVDFVCLDKMLIIDEHNPKAYFFLGGHQ